MGISIWILVAIVTFLVGLGFHYIGVTFKDDYKELSFTLRILSTILCAGAGVTIGYTIMGVI